MNSVQWRKLEILLHDDNSSMMQMYATENAREKQTLVINLE